METLDRIEREIELSGVLDDSQRTRLLAIANKCPVHRTLHSEVTIPTRLRNAETTRAPRSDDSSEPV